MNTIDSPDAAEAEQELCISCVRGNEPGTHFCRHCGTPLTSYVATAPFESLFALGDVMRKAIWGKRWGVRVRTLTLVCVVALVVKILIGMFLPV